MMPSAATILAMQSLTMSVFDDAPLVLVLEALVAGDAAADRLARELHQLGLDAFLFKLGKDVPDQDGGVAVLAGAAVECDDFHGTFPFT